MDYHNVIFIGLLLALLLFKKSRYASFVYLVSFAFYVNLFQFMPKNYYYAFSATTDLFVALSLSKGHHFQSVKCLLNWKKYNVNQFVSVLSVLLVFVNLQGYLYHINNMPSGLYKSTYITIVSIQIALLYLGVILNARDDRRNSKRSVVWVNDSNNNRVGRRLYNQDTKG